MPQEDLFRPDPREHERWCFLAEKIKREPELLKIPLSNIARWREGGRIASFWALDLWEEKIVAAQESEEGMQELIGFLESDLEDSRQLKSSSPFPGVLTTAELDQFTCASIL